MFCNFLLLSELVLKELFALQVELDAEKQRVVELTRLHNMEKVSFSSCALHVQCLYA